MSEETLNMIVERVADELKMQQREILSARQAAKYLDLSLSHLYKLTMAHAIPFSKPGGKVCYFKKSDLDAYMLSNRIATSDEIRNEARQYCKKGGQV